VTLYTDTTVPPILSGATTRLLVNLFEDSFRLHQHYRQCTAAVQSCSPNLWGTGGPDRRELCVSVIRFACSLADLLKSVSNTRPRADVRPGLLASVLKSAPIDALRLLRERRYFVSIAVTPFETPILEPAAWIASEKPAFIEGAVRTPGQGEVGTMVCRHLGGCGGIFVRSWYCSSVGPAAPRTRADGMLHTAQQREVLMPLRIATAATLAALFMVPSSGISQVLMQRDVSLRMALTIAEAALAECGVNTSVAVVDRAGRLRVFLQGDKAAPHNLELARRKAYTARTFQRTSAEWAKLTETTNAGQRMLADVIPLGGGVPIKVGEETIGGVGLSGAPMGQAQEEACAKAGIAKVADQLR